MEPKLSCYALIELVKQETRPLTIKLFLTVVNTTGMGDLLEYEFTREGTRIALLCPYLGKKPYAAHLSGSRVLLQLSVVVETSLESGAGLREDEDK